jgi:hypothetical protein
MLGSSGLQQVTTKKPIYPSNTYLFYAILESKKGKLSLYRAAEALRVARG